MNFTRMINRVSRLRHSATLVFLFFIFNGCGNNPEERAPDTPTRGTIHISVDESFKPVIDSQIKVYESSNPETKIIAHYKTEAECLDDFFNDSIRMIIATRGHSPEEKQIMEDSIKLTPKSLVIAYDAISVIVNPLSPDTLLTMDEVRQILKGKFKKPLVPVFDGLRATSTVRFIIDSVLDGDSLTPNALGAKSSEEVINYVSTHPGSIGFIGVSWIGNKEDSTHLSYLTKVRVVQLESTDTPGSYVYPVQANIYMRRYPMVRDLVYILQERHRGLGTGFSNFLSSQRGQLVFRRAYLVPAQISLNVRKANLRE